MLIRLCWTNTRSNHCPICLLCLAHIYIRTNEFHSQMDIYSYDISNSMYGVSTLIYLYIHVSDHALQNVIYTVVVKMAMAEKNDTKMNWKKAEIFYQKRIFVLWIREENDIEHWIVWNSWHEKIMNVLLIFFSCISVWKALIVTGFN